MMIQQQNAISLARVTNNGFSGWKISAWNVVKHPKLRTFTAIMGIIISISIFSCSKDVAMSDAEMKAYLAKCYSELETKQIKLQKRYGLGAYQEYWYNQETQTIQFKDSGIVQMEFDVIFIGTWAKHKNNWLWSWANNSMLDPVKEKSKRIQSLQAITGNDVYTTPNFDADENRAFELTSLAVHVLNAQGFYRSPGENSDLFLAIMDRKR